jgi:hypothetical protein
MTIFYAVKRAHGLEFEREPLYRAYVAGLPEGKRYEVQIKRYRPKRTNQQNKYYWSTVVQMIADETGMSKDHTHDALRQKFLTVPGDGPLRVIRSTTELTTVEMMKYVDECVLFAAEFLQIVIPQPDYQGEI